MGRKKKSKSTIRSVTSYRYQKGGWDVEPEEPLAECIYTKDTYLLLTAQVITKCHALMVLAGDDEWLGYLAISKEETDDHLIYTAHDLVVPWQEVSGTSVEVCAFPVQDDQNIRSATNEKVYLGGVVHSHHNMSIKFSTTDHEFINKNSEVSLLLANSFGFHAEAITKTLCGKKTKQEIQVIPFTKDRISVFGELEDNFRDRIRNVTEISTHTTGWGYSYPSEQRVAEPIMDIISLTQDDGTVEIIVLNERKEDGGDTDDTGDEPAVDQVTEEVTQGSD